MFLLPHPIKKKHKKNTKRMLIIGDWLLKFQPDYDRAANRFRRDEMVLGACVSVAEGNYDRLIGRNW
jgi:hypothetical protein